MPSMFRRPSFYLLVVALIGVIALITYVVRIPRQEVPKVVPDQAKPASGSASGSPVPIPQTSSPPETTRPSTVDPVHQQMADQLNSPESTPQRDLEILREFLSIYRKAYRSGNPVGLNEDITAAITGTANPQAMGQIFPRQSAAIRGGQLVDRWGTPFYFHPESGTKMEIRSAGPDKQLFTGDDIILQP